MFVWLSTIIQKLRPFLQGSDFKKNFLFIFSSKLLIAIVSFITTPFVARLFAPADYGLFALLNSAGVICSIFSNLTLPVSVVVVDEKAFKSTATAVANYIIFSNGLLLLAGLTIAFGRPLHNLLLSHGGIDVTWHICFLVVAFSLLEGFSQLFANINIRYHQFKRNITVNIIDNFSAKATSLAIGIFRHTSFGLFYAELTGKSINVTTQLIAMRSIWTVFERKSLGTLSSMISLFKEHRHFVFYSFPVSLITRFSAQLILWIFAIFYSRQMIGNFTMAISLLNIPLQLVANSFQPIVIKRLQDDGQRRTTFIRLVIAMGALATGIYLGVYFLSPWFIKVYLGPNWLDSIAFVKMLSVPLALQLVGNSLEGAFVVFKKQKAQFNFKLFFLIIFIFAIFLIARVDASIQTVVLAYGIVVALEEMGKILFLIVSIGYVGSRKVL